MRTSLLILTALTLLTQSGCVVPNVMRAVAESLQRCTVESQPPGAIVRINGERVGFAPCEAARPFGNGGRRRFTVTASLNGYQTSVQEFNDFPQYVSFDLVPRPTYVTAAELADCDVTTLPRRGAARSVAVLDFLVADDLARSVGTAVADYCRETIQQCPCFILVDREYMRAVLSEADFAATFECDDTRCLVDYGRQLQAQLLVHGRVTQIDETRVLTLKMIDVGSGEVIAVRNVRVGANVDDLLDLTQPITCRVLRDALDDNTETAQVPVETP